MIRRILDWYARHRRLPTLHMRAQPLPHRAVIVVIHVVILQTIRLPITLS